MCPVFDSHAERKSVFKWQLGHVPYCRPSDRTVFQPWWFGLFCKSFKNRHSWKISCCCTLVLDWDCSWGMGMKVEEEEKGGSLTPSGDSTHMETWQRLGLGADVSCPLLTSCFLTWESCGVSGLLRTRFKEIVEQVGIDDTAGCNVNTGYQGVSRPVH